jgi:hypothetical protein
MTTMSDGHVDWLKHEHSVACFLKADAYDKEADKIDGEIADLPKHHIGEAAKPFIRDESIRLGRERDKKRALAKVERRGGEYAASGIHELGLDRRNDSDYMGRHQARIAESYKRGIVKSDVESFMPSHWG